jgi:hypothetical protein
VQFTLFINSLAQSQFKSLEPTKAALIPLAAEPDIPATATNLLEYLELRQQPR